MPAYDSNNVFAKILRGELPCHKVYEDDKAFHILDVIAARSGARAGDPEGPCPQFSPTSPPANLS